MTESHTLFPTRVFEPGNVPNLLVSGHNSAKIGDRVTKGAWCGFPIFTLTLEERATCPTTCGLLRECFGNSMPLARRHAHGPGLIERLDCDLRDLGRQYPAGFAVRLHVLGDFYSVEYVKAWLGWMDDVPALHVFGYTAHHYHSAIGIGLDAANDLWPDRWSIRFSVAPETPIDSYMATTIWRKPEAANVPEGLVCPASTHATACCGTCGLCWAPGAAGKRIVFVGHGKRSRKGPRKRP